MMADADAMVCVHVCFSRPESEVIKSKLNACGIPSVIKARSFADLHGHLLVALGGLRIEVPHWALEESIDIVQSGRQPSSTPESDAFAKHGGFNLVLFFLLFWFAGAFPYLPFWIRKQEYAEELFR